ncbi:MAG: dTDP-glucose 4,6-dehydratase, partial [Thermodesulfobacteriota bacterium]
MKILVTGGAGFIGSNFVRYILEVHPAYEVVNLDLLTYAGNLENLADLEGRKNYRFVRGDIADLGLLDGLFAAGVDGVVNFAAESHVDRSIEAPGHFLATNILGTQALLETARRYRVNRFLQISTDEVYGSLAGKGAFTEQSPLAPNSPYSASKASADLLCRAYWKTYDLPVMVTRCSNNYGPYQFPEKLIPLFITNALADEPLPVYGDGLYVRDWIYVRDHCSALDRVLHDGRAGEIYNVGADAERTNLEITQTILEKLDKDAGLVRHVKDRPGHDRRYAIDSSKIRTELGWRPETTFQDGMAETIDWYLRNEPWWQKIKSGE